MNLHKSNLSKNEIIEECGRHILVPGISETGQKCLGLKHLLLLGLSALGTISSQYLARAGIGKITLIDYDKVSLSNLHRQINYNKSHIEELKSEVSKKVLSNINSVTDIFQYPIAFEDYIKKNDVNNLDYILDCSDNYQTKTNSSLFAKNKCISYSSISINSSEGIFFSQDYKNLKDTNCFKCLFPKMYEQNNRCLNSAMIGPTAGFVSSLACNKIILGLAKKILKISSEILLIDLLTSDINKLELKQSKCNHTYDE